MVTLFRDDRRTSIQVLQPDTTIAVSFTNTSAQSDAINSGVVRLVATQDCHVSFGLNPTATAGHMFMPAGSVEYFKISENLTKIAVIRSTSNGYLYITKMS